MLLWWSFASLTLVIGRSSSAHAQGAAGAPPPAAPGAAGSPAEGAAGAPANTGLVPPKLLADAAPQYPEQAKAERLEATVVVQLTIDATGQVTEASVVEPVGHGFDEAASEAALRLRFEPARNHGAPIAAKIRYPFSFKPEPQPAPAPPPAAPTPEPPSAAPPPPAASAPSLTEVHIAGQRSAAEKLQQSAEAVNVIDTRKAQQQTVDLGEVLARSQGVAVRRNGGLGSNTRFSLNGLYDEQVRFFLDGLPLDIAGFPLGVSNVPVNLIERLEVYRGVVPVRFGADALGGAVNLVTDQTFQSKLAASYQIGSFGTHRVTVDGRYHHAPSGFVVSASGYFDYTKNNYEIDVDIPNAQGREFPARVRRFHDAYRAYGATLEAGIIDRPWAKRLLLRGTLSSYDKELQHNVVMRVPYGEVTYGESVAGAAARYEVEPAKNVTVEAIASYALRTIDYVDKAEWVYNWRGERVRERPVGGEIEAARPHDQTIWQHTVFGRAVSSWVITPAHQLRLSLTPSYTTRTGDERIQTNPDARDPLTAQRDLFTLVTGLEYELNLLGDRLSNIAFVKDYYYSAQSEERLPGEVYRERDSRTHAQGVGDSLRLRITPWLYAKTSYEYATRLPTAYEVFGNGVLIQPNLEIEPEVSHNGNLGPRIELPRTPVGAFTLDINGFIRSSKRLIVLLGSERFFSYQNVYNAMNIGVEAAANWSSPGRWLSLDGMITWQDLRNRSKRGTFADFDGDRIPNRPYLFGSWGARVRVPNLPGKSDTLEPFYFGRYVHSFYRGWESQGLREFKQVIDSQVTHSVGLSWTLTRDWGRLATTAEIDNFTDAKVFDNFGVQRPGRAFYVKITGELR